jgi:hypothetical protein
VDEHDGGKVWRRFDKSDLQCDIADDPQPYSLTFPGRNTVGQVKRDVATVTKIPVFRQVGRHCEKRVFS